MLLHRKTVKDECSKGVQVCGWFSHYLCIYALSLL